MKSTESCFGQMCIDCRNAYTFQVWSLSIFAFLVGVGSTAIWVTWVRQ